MDEPEVFLHPSLISELASVIKKTEEKNITTIFTTHSPSLLSHFVNELLSNGANLTILQKDESGKIKKPLYFDKIIVEINKEAHEHTLKIFFSKSVLFVEGMTEYVLFTSEFMRREIPAVREIE
ncbi:7127_t:CDS:2, partial [Cetraspora pellucida]